MAQHDPSAAEEGFRWWRDKRSEEHISQCGRSWRGEPELCLSRQPGLSLDLSHVQGGRALLAAGPWAWGSPRQVGESLLNRSIQASGTSSSAGCQGACETPKMLPLLLVWKTSVTVLLKSVCSWGMFWWFGVFHWRKHSVERILEKSACCYMTCCCILLSGIQHAIRQVSADSWEGDKTNISPGYLISCSSCNLFLKLFVYGARKKTLSKALVNFQLDHKV